ncbi:MAG: hypothetical protein V3U54_13000 [Thermodesulfobacteriota bacterium]
MQQENNKSRKARLEGLKILGQFNDAQSVITAFNLIFYPLRGFVLSYEDTSDGEGFQVENVVRDAFYIVKDYVERKSKEPPKHDPTGFNLHLGSTYKPQKKEKEIIPVSPDVESSVNFVESDEEKEKNEQKIQKQTVANDTKTETVSVQKPSDEKKTLEPASPKPVKKKIIKQETEERLEDKPYKDEIPVEEKPNTEPSDESLTEVSDNTTSEESEESDTGFTSDSPFDD